MKSLHLSADGTVFQSAAASRNYPWGLAGLNNAVTDANKANVQVPMHSAGTLTRFWVRIATNDRGASTSFLQVNGTNSALTVSIPSSSTGEFEDATNTVTIAAGDLLSYRITTGSGGTTFNVSQMATLFEPTSGTDVVRHTAVGALTTSVDSETASFPIVGQMSGVPSEATQQIVWRETTATARRPAVRVSANSRTTATSFTLRRNGADSTVLISVAASTTGLLQDSTVTQAISVGDTLNWRRVTGTGGGSITTQFCAVEMAVDEHAQMFAACIGAGVAQAAALTRWCPISGELVVNTNESHVRSKMQWAGRISRLRAHVSANTLNAAATVTTRKNSAAGGQTLTIATGLTGTFEDATGSDIFAAADYMGYETSTAAASSGSITWTNLSAGAEVVTAAIVNQVTETDLAQTVTRRPLVGQVVETDLAQRIVQGIIRTVAQVTETDTAQAVVNVVSRTVTDNLGLLDDGPVEQSSDDPLSMTDDIVVQLGGGAATVSGAAVLTGTGALTGTGQQTATGAAALTGAGTLSADGRIFFRGAVVMTGTGTLTTTGRRTTFGAATLSGQGTLVGGSRQRNITIRVKRLERKWELEGAGV